MSEPKTPVLYETPGLELNLNSADHFERVLSDRIYNQLIFDTPDGRYLFSLSTENELKIKRDNKKTPTIPLPKKSQELLNYALECNNSTVPYAVTAYLRFVGDSSDVNLEQLANRLAALPCNLHPYFKYGPEEYISREHSRESERPPSLPPASVLKRPPQPRTLARIRNTDVPGKLQSISQFKSTTKTP